MENQKRYLSIPRFVVAAYIILSNDPGPTVLETETVDIRTESIANAILGRQFIGNVHWKALSSFDLVTVFGVFNSILDVRDRRFFFVPTNIHV